MAARGVAITAVHFRQFVANINRVYEIFYLGAFGDILLCLAENNVAQVAILGNKLAGGILMLSVVTAETSGEVEVSHM